MAELNLRAAAKQSWDTIFAQAYPKLADMIRSINEEMDRTSQDSKREIRSITLAMDRLDERLTSTKSSIALLIKSQESINSYLSKIDLSPSENVPNINTQLLQTALKNTGGKGGLSTGAKVAGGAVLGAGAMAVGNSLASQGGSGGALSALSSADNIKFIADKIIFSSSKIIGGGEGSGSGGSESSSGAASGGSSGAPSGSGGTSSGQSGSTGGSTGGPPSSSGGNIGGSGEGGSGVTSGSSGMGSSRAIDSSGFGPTGGQSYLVPGRNSRVAASNNMRFDATRVGGVGGQGSSQGDYYNDMYSAVYEAAKESGLPYPEVIASLGASQTSLETGYGKHMVGNNAFGIKGTGSAGTVNANTQEFVGGKMVGMKQGFRAYGDVRESANDYVAMMLKNQKRYSGVLTAKTVEEAIAAQAKSGYATDPNYGAKLASINSKFGGQAGGIKPETKIAKSGPAINNASVGNKVGNEKLAQSAPSTQINNLITQSPSSQTPNQEPPKTSEVDVRGRLGRLVAQT